MCVILASEHFAECRQAGGHGNWIGVVRPPMKDLVLRDQVHHRLVSTECSQRQTASDGLGQTDHVGDHAEIFRCSPPAQLGASFHFVVDQQRSVLGGDLA